MPKKHKISELDQMFLDAESIDQAIFSEMRSNVRLIAGDHYTRGASSRYFKRLRNHGGTKQEQKLRITKNYIGKTFKIYLNHIMSTGPNVGFTPNNENELQDQKVTEMNEAVWRHAETTQRLDKKRRKWAEDYIGIGEVFVKQFYDPDAGSIVGYESSGEYDAQGHEIPDEDKPVHMGEIKFELIHGFNLLRSPDAKTLEESPYLINRKMVSIQDLQAAFPDKASKIKPTMDKTYRIFDSNSGAVRNMGKNEALVKEFYWRPSAEYPEGFFQMYTESVDLASGELPGGVFPINYATYEEIPTSPRGRSFVKQARAPQAEINRTSSKMAEHQITLGDDKLLIQNGTKVTAGASLPGVRSVNYTGMPPTILQGRDGSQYLPYLQENIHELKDITNTRELDKEGRAKTDAYAMLFQAASAKKEFALPIQAFEQFLIDVTNTHLALARVHYENYAVIKAVGKPEAVNMEEFRAAPDTSFTVKVVAQSEDLHTKMGKQMALNHIIQFAGAQLGPEHIAKIIREMPFVNTKNITEDLTLDYDSAVNSILALDRGQLPVFSQFDNHVNMIKMLTGRMRKADFPMMPPEVQQNYQQVVQLHEQQELENQQRIQEMEAGFIPTGGPLTGVDFFVPNPKDPSKTRRARVPFESINWLIEMIEKQGSSLEKLEQLNPSTVAHMADNLMKTDQAQRMGQIPQ